ncbi:MAG: hybrid sensor histidine kinase/response regulator [Chloroflexota bacterium]|nr:hybrid sensor histidine kinase/response regulator [Chloroflexota bacterium]
MNSQQTDTFVVGDILIVDDTPDTLHVLSQMLTDRGYQVRAVTRGSQALAAVQTMPPDLILLDIMMPEMNGYQVCKHLKANEQTRDIPIIFISAIDATEDKVNAFAAGGVDYVTKPFHFKEVFARVETHIELRGLQKQLQAVNRELERQVQELEERNEELDAYDHTVAHDLKGPLTTIIGLADVLKEIYTTMPDEELQGSLYAIAQNGRKMNNIIEELLLLAGVRQAKTVKIEPLDMASVVAAAQTRLSYMIAEHQAEIILPNSWPTAMGYGPWLEEVWVNYISNAIKYGGKPPRVELGATTETDDTVRFWVRDNGSGITPDEQARLFTPFEQLSQTRAKGHGLGLSIVQRIVEKIGRNVEVESKVGQGSVFSFTLPSAGK